MTNKQWSTLNKMQSGKCAEYFVNMEFTANAFEVYAPVIDDQGIDFIVRGKNKNFLDIQVKSIRGYDNIPIAKSKFDITKENLYLVAVHFIDNKEPELYLIPASVWQKPNDIFTVSDGPDVEKPQYGLRLSEKHLPELIQYTFQDAIKALL